MTKLETTVVSLYMYKGPEIAKTFDEASQVANSYTYTAHVHDAFSQCLFLIVWKVKMDFPLNVYDPFSLHVGKMVNVWISISTCNLS